jgi:hypothetical protein
MAVANSTTQILVPGLDKSVQDNLNTSLNTNATLLSVLAAASRSSFPSGCGPP